MTKHDNSARLAGIAMLKAGTATLHEVAKLAGCSNQAATRWLQVQKDHKRTRAIDWQANRAEYLVREWYEHLKKFES